MTPSIKETVERLREYQIAERDEATDTITWKPNPETHAAAALIERLAGALDLCAAVLNNSHIIETTDGGRVPLTNTMEALIAARRALSGETTP